MITPKTKVLVTQLGSQLVGKKLMLVTAESCTGGLVAATVTSMPGSSAWFERGFVTYTNGAKQQLLAVSNAILRQHGAVSCECAYEMAKGALENSDADVSLAITGIAGPGGGEANKSVGTVCFAFITTVGKKVIAKHFIGDRDAIRQQAVLFSLQSLLSLV